YEWGHAYLDGYASALVNSFTLREHGHPVAYLSKEYDAGMAAYLLQIARHWPADMLVRAYASVLRVVDVPFHVGTYTAVVPYGLANPRLISAYKNTTQLNALAGLGVVSVALALTIISSRSVRAAVVLLALLIYFAGYPALQFQIRHFFHL